VIATVCEVKPTKGDTSVEEEVRLVREELRLADEADAQRRLQGVSSAEAARLAREAELDAEDAAREARKPKVEAGIKKYATQVLSKLTNGNTETSGTPTGKKANMRLSLKCEALPAEKSPLTSVEGVPSPPAAKASSDEKRHDPRRDSQMRKSSTIVFGQQKMKSSADLVSPAADEQDEIQNPLWEVINASIIDMKRLKDVIMADESYVNCALDRAAGVPSALFYAVVMRLPEMVKLLVECKADVRQKHSGQKPWRKIRHGETPMEVNQKQKLEYLGTQVYDRCEAIAEVMAAEQDRIKSWEGGRRVSCQKVAERYFRTSTMDLMQMPVSEIELQDQKAKQDVAKMGQIQENLENTPEAVMAMKVLYTAEATCILQHISTDPKTAFDEEVEVGDGTFGIVHRMRCKHTGLVRAMKTVPKEFLEEADLWQEIKLMREMDHPCVARLFGTYEDAENVHMVMEHCSGGELFNVIDSMGNLPQATAASMFQQMLISVNYIHSRKVCHRDLKPENFLLSWDVASSESWLVKLIDFGTAKSFSSENPMTTKICTIHYVAPEILVRGEVVYDEKCDIWSLGACLFLMICGNLPFSGETDAVVIKLVRKGKFKFEPEELWQDAEDVRDLISSILQVDSKQRLSAYQALQHPWFRAKVRRPDTSLRLEEAIPRLLHFHTLSWFKRAALQLLASQLPEDQLHDLRPLWFDLDARHVGKISCEDLARIVPARDLSQDRRSLQAALFQRMREEGKGEMGYTTFIAAMLDRERRRNAAVCKSVFRELDLDNDNFIRMTELNILYQSVQQKAGGGDKPALSRASGAENGSREACEKVLQLYDRDKDEALSFSEFLLVVGEDTS